MSEKPSSQSAPKTGQTPAPAAGGAPGAPEPKESKAAILKAKALAEVENQVEKLKVARNSALQLAKGPAQLLGQLTKSVASPDIETRRMARLFLLALLGVVFVIVFGAVQFVRSRQ